MQILAVDINPGISPYPSRWRCAGGCIRAAGERPVFTEQPLHTVCKMGDIQTVTRHRVLETMTKSPLKLVPPAIVKRTVSAPGT